MKHTRLILFLLTLCVPPPLFAQTEAPAPFSTTAIAAALPAAQTTPQAVAPAAPSGRVQDFVDLAILSPTPYIVAVGYGVTDQVVEYPVEWTGNKGFGQRTLARVAHGLASDAITHSLAAALHHNVRYEPCICNGAWKRTTHALGWGFATRHENGEMVMHTSLFAAKFAAAGLANAWYPASYTGADVLREGVIGIGVNALVNVTREYAPELKRLIGIR